MSFDPNLPFALHHLPPPIQVQNHPDLFKLLDAHNVALQAVSQLEGSLRELENPELFLSTFYLQESISSNAVESIHTTIESVLEDETKPYDEQLSVNKEVLFYRQALSSGRTSLAKFGLSSRTIKAVHKELKIKKGVPGEYRRVQNGIGNKAADGAIHRIYTPPSWQHVELLISNWENYAAGEDPKIFHLIKTAICHYQFEAIHPFEDGNGRTGRIIMLLQLLELKLLSYPALFLSGYLSDNETLYKSLLLSVTAHGNWWGFIEFMLHGFAIQAFRTKLGILSLKKAKKALKRQLFEMDSAVIPKRSVAVVTEHVFTHPMTHAMFMSRETGIHWQTCTKYLRSLVKLGALEEQASGKYNFFRNSQVFAALVARKPGS